MLRLRQEAREYHVSTGWCHRGSSINSSAAFSSAQIAVLDSEDEYEAEEDEFYNLELLARQQMSSHITHYERLNMRSLDLEPAESIVWDDDEYDSLIFEEDILHGEHNNIEDDFWSLSEPTQSTTTKKKTAKELLENFDPQNPPDTDDPEELQIWLECQSYEEGMRKYQKVLDDARNRKDYSSMSVFQKQVLRWFPLVRDHIARMQSEYMLKPSGSSQKSTKRYGPYLCTLPPEKMAVIAAHEAMMMCLLKPGKNGNLGCPFVTIAKKIGETVEHEILVHRLLHKRMMEQKERIKKEAESDKTKEGREGDAGVDDDGEKEVEDEVGKKDDAESDNNEPAVEGAPANWIYAGSHLNRFLDNLSRNDLSVKKKRVIQYAITRARQVLNKEEWSEPDRVGLGAALFHCILENAQVTINGQDVPAFSYEKRWVAHHRQQCVVILNENLYDKIIADKVSNPSAMTTRYKPMILPPKPWKSSDEGGYLWLKAELMRYHGCNIQKDAVDSSDMSTLHQGLNVLGQVPWRINKRILETAVQCWEQDISLGDIPSRSDFEIPPEPIPPPRIPGEIDKESPAYENMVTERKKYTDAMHKFRRFRQKNMDLRSLRCSAMLKLDQAEKFKNFDKIYFPYVSIAKYRPCVVVIVIFVVTLTRTLSFIFVQNIDFRGRAYPIPPHLSNVGSDLCRGILYFSEEKPLGKRGLYWLKVHLANLAGVDKVTFDERAAFVDKNMEKVRQSAKDPFAGERWWMGLDDPFQGLSTCIEIVNAEDSGDPESYMCSLPVHMDGSCNGLQHYAALGRDLVGGKAVNLCADNEPQDVYIGVMHEVIRRVKEEAERTMEFDTSNIDSLNNTQKKDLKNHRAAKLVNGLIDRGVVKRTVMTSVYGVTYIGARTQIQEKIRSKLEGLGYDIDEINNEIFLACGYLATITMQAVGDLFVGAKQTMDWLTTCARLITQHGYPVAWISPIGVPAIQPYRQKKSSTIVTLVQTVTLTDEHDDLPIHKTRQVSAFPPNYIHSLDSSHMLLTALEMDKRGLAFSAVHDSFWTHPCDVDEMNDTLRQVFVDLYSQPLLEQLKAGWEMRYPGLEFPDLPKRGTLKLDDVKEAPYFFQ